MNCTLCNKRIDDTPYSVLDDWGEPVDVCWTCVNSEIAKIDVTICWDCGKFTMWDDEGICFSCVEEKECEEARRDEIESEHK